MSILRKSNKPVSSRRQIQIKGVKDGILELPNYQYRLILQVSSVNFELMSEEEQDALVDTYQNFLNSLSTPLQIQIRIREMDVDKYLERFSDRVADEEQQIYIDQAKNYSKFVKGLITNNKILTRQFYITIPYSSTDKDFLFAKEQLHLTADIVSKGISRLGMQTRVLSSLEVMELFYSFYSPALSKRQPLKQQTLRMIQESYV